MGPLTASPLLCEGAAPPGWTGLWASVALLVVVTLGRARLGWAGRVSGEVLELGWVDLWAGPG